jgi:hypothetical protein
VFGVYAPACLPAEILTTQAVTERIAGLGGNVAPMPPTAFGAKAYADRARFGKLTKERRMLGD